LSLSSSRCPSVPEIISEVVGGHSWHHIDMTSLKCAADLTVLKRVLCHLAVLEVLCKNKTKNKIGKKKKHSKEIQMLWFIF